MAKIVKPEQTREYYVAPNIDLGLEPVFEQARKNKEEEKQKARALAEERQKQLDANMGMLDSARGYVSEDGIWAGVTNDYADTVYNKAKKIASEGDYEAAANFVEQNMVKVKRYDANQKQVSGAITDMSANLNNDYFVGGEGLVARYLTDKVGKHMTNPTVSGDVLANINKYASEQDLLSYASKQGALDENAVTSDFLKTFNDEKYTNPQGGYLQKKGFTDSSGNVKSVGELISEGYVDVATSSPAMRAVLDQHITEMAGSEIDEGAETGTEAYAKALREVLSPKLTTNVKANPADDSGSDEGVGLGNSYKIEPDKLDKINKYSIRLFGSGKDAFGDEITGEDREQIAEVHEMVKQNFGSSDKLQTEFFLKNLPKDIDKSSFEDGAEIIPLKRGKSLKNVVVKGEEADVRNFVKIGGEIYATVSVDVEVDDFKGFRLFTEGDGESEKDKELKKKTKEANKLVKLSGEEFQNLTGQDPKEYVGDTETETRNDSDILPPSAK